MILVLSNITCKGQPDFGDFAVELHERITAICGDIVPFDSILDVRNSTAESLTSRILAFGKGKLYKNAIFVICGHGKLLVLGNGIPIEKRKREISIVMVDGKILRVSEIERIVVNSFPTIASIVSILDVCLIFHYEEGKCSVRYEQKIDDKDYPRNNLLNVKRMYITTCRPGQGSKGTDSVGGIRLLFDVFHFFFLKDKNLDLMKSFLYASSIFGTQIHHKEGRKDEDNEETLCTYDERLSENTNAPFNLFLS